MLLDDEAATFLVMEAAEHRSTADLAKEISDALGLGALTTLLKENGSIRGIVKGDTFGRGVARTMAQECAKKFEEAQHALHASGDRLRCSIGQIVDGVGSQEDSVVNRRQRAFDHIRRKSMMEDLYTNPALAPRIPFDKMFYGKESTYLWYDDDGVPHEILKGERGDQKDPLMPALYALGQHAALTQVDASLHEGEMLFAFLDDIYILCDPSSCR